MLEDILYALYHAWLQVHWPELVALACLFVMAYVLNNRKST